MCVRVQLMKVRSRVVYMCVVCRRNARRGRSGWGSRAERAQLSIGSGVRAHVRVGVRVLTTLIAVPAGDA